MRLRSMFTVLVLTLGSSVTASLRGADQPIEMVIDRHIAAALADAGITPAPQADDATLIRRLTLDLVGRIPTASEVEAYVRSTDSDKRAKLVDRLIASPGFVRHQAALFEMMLAAEGPRHGGARVHGALAAPLHHVRILLCRRVGRPLHLPRNGREQAR